MFLFNPAIFLLSSIGIANGFYANHKYQINLLRHATFFKSNSNLFKESINRFASRRRKGIEDIVVDGILDSTKKLLSLEEAITNPPRKQIKTFQPKTENQKAFVELMRDDKVDIIIAIGPAGTGKTMLACYAAVEALRLKKVNKIVVTRPVVSVDEEIGYLPGGLESKMDPWTRPIFDTLRETYSAKEIERMTEEGVIEIVPLGFMRGRTFKNAWIIADEMQNSSPMQMFMLATRIGEGSKMIITGDLNQSDRDSNDNGLLEIYKKVKRTESINGLNYVRYIELDKEDVQRSRAAKIILDIYESDVDSDQDPDDRSAPSGPYSEEKAISSHPSQTIDVEIDPNADFKPSDVEWIDVQNNPQVSPNNKNNNDDNDAALIPLRYMKRVF
jgi:phosphate starvation-inducible PhoH-like protein